MFLKALVLWGFCSAFWILSVNGGENKKEEEGLEGIVDSLVGDEEKDLLSPGVKRVHDFVLKHLEEKRYEGILNSKDIISLVNTLDLSKNQSDAKLGVLLDKIYGLVKNGISFESLKKEIPRGGDLSEALIALHQTAFQNRNKKQNKKKSDPTSGLMELMTLLMAGKTDFTFVNKALEFFKREPAYVANMILDLTVNFKLVSKEMSRAISANLIPILENDIATPYVEGFYNATLQFFQSSSGERFIKGFPRLIQDPSTANFFAFLREETRWNAKLFFSSLENSDYKSDVLKSVASVIVKILSYCEGLFSDKSVMMLNGVLQSQGLPAYDPSKPVRTLGSVIDKGIRLFTTSRVDVSPYIDAAEKVFEDVFESKEWKLLFSLDEIQRTNAIHRFLDDEMMEPIELIWRMQSFMSENNSWGCSERFLCHLNSIAKKSKNDIRQGLTFFSSVSVAWMWNAEANDDAFWRHYEAVWNGLSGECEEKYPNKNINCAAFRWQKSLSSLSEQPKMELNYDKSEL